MIKKNKETVLALAALAMMSISKAQATENLVEATFDNLSISIAPGLLTVTAHKYVYDNTIHQFNSNKLSELIWRANNTPILKTELSYDWLSWLGFHASGWSTFLHTKAPMDDYDWDDPTQSRWTSWSHSENTRLNYANELDFSVRIWLLKKQAMQLGLIGGYQTNKFNWTARGGSYVYYFDGEAERGRFPENRLMVSYRQKYKMPYIGLTANYVMGSFELNTLLKFSDWANGYAFDRHHLKNVSYIERVKGVRYYSMGLNAGYHLKENFTLFANATYNNYLNKIGDMRAIGKRKQFIYKDSAGLSNQNYIISLGIKYQF